MKTNVLVTGASGFVGRKIVEALQPDRELALSVLLRNPDKDRVLTARGARIYKGDIGDPETLKEALAGKEIVIHSAALMSNFDSFPREEFYRINAAGTENMLKACDPARLERFLHISTVGVYGDAPSAYEWSKKESERIVLKYAKERAIPFTILRPSQLYGPGMRYGWPQTIKSIKTGRMVIPGNGRARVHLLNIADLAAAVKLTLRNDSAKNRIYDIAGPEVLSIGEVFDIISEDLGVRPPARVPFSIIYFSACVLRLIPSRLKSAWLRLLTPHRLEFFARDHVYDMDAAQKELGFNPKVRVREGFTEMIRWCEQEGLI